MRVLIIIICLFMNSSAQIKKYLLDEKQIDTQKVCEESKILYINLNITKENLGFNFEKYENEKLNNILIKSIVKTLKKEIIRIDLKQIDSYQNCSLIVAAPKLIGYEMDCIAGIECGGTAEVEIAFFRNTTSKEPFLKIDGKDTGVTAYGKSRPFITAFENATRKLKRKLRKSIDIFKTN